MITAIHFKNFKALRDTTLPLGQFTLIVGPNGSGKSTAMQALSMARSSSIFPGNIKTITSAGSLETGTPTITIHITIHLDSGNTQLVSETTLEQRGVDHVAGQTTFRPDWGLPPDSIVQQAQRELASFQIFSFDPQAIATPVMLDPGAQLASQGGQLAVVLDTLRDGDPERFEALNRALGRWFPEFDRILFETPSMGTRAFSLRTRVGRHAIRANDLSHGTLVALAFLTLAYLPNPPRIICFEEPERGIHPRLLREIQDAMYRLCYPQDHGEEREPVQVIATTHSPYLLDLYKDHPEEIVIANKEGQNVRFERLSDMANAEKILQDAPLGEVWYTGILGGVPSMS